MNRLEGLVCLISGSTGIAASSAERFAAEGGSVFVTSRNEQHCRKLVDRILAGGGRAAYHAAELTDESEVDAVVERCVATFGRIDAAFLVAGASGRRWGDGPIHELTTEGWERTLELNLRTTALAARAVVRQMLEQPPREAGRRGALLLMSSVTAFEPVPRYFGTHAYAAAKGAIASLATAMAATYAPVGIRVNAVAPSVTDTPMARRAATDPVIVAFARHKQPLAGGLLDPDDVALAATYLLSDEARAVTGQLLAIDGGWSVTSYGPPADAEGEG